MGNRRDNGRITRANGLFKFGDLGTSQLKVKSDQTNGDLPVSARCIHQVADIYGS